MTRKKPESSSDDSDWLTTAEVAALLRVHPKHVYRLLHQGMPARRVGGQWRFSRDAIQRWADQRGEPLAESSSGTAATTTTLIAAEANEVSRAVVAALAQSTGLRLATVASSTTESIEALSSGEVTAAIVRAVEPVQAACATVRIALGSRIVGLLKPVAATTAEGVVAIPATLAYLPKKRTAQDVACSFLPVDGELDACASLIRGDVDAAFGSEAVARQFGLGFEPILSEPWQLVVRVDAMEEPALSRLCIAAQTGLQTHLEKVLSDVAEHGGRMHLERGIQPGPSQAVAISDTWVAEKPSRKAPMAVRWTILARDRAEQMLDLVDVLRHRGVSVGGFLQLPSGPASAKPMGYDLFRLRHPERLPIAERNLTGRRNQGERFCELTFHKNALVRACEWLREDVETSDVLIVDGVGRLEQRGQGLFPALAWARMQPRSTMIVLSSRWNRVPQVTQRLALSGPQVTELSFGHHDATPPHIIEHIMRACKKSPRSHRVVEGS
ncbi:MAG TPA: helix-turn-helix domain-containing protein [Polyangiaceae bacterium]|jgi:excisionase family DNA binding protein|nr:MAG: Helix-turn-helix domain protein [Deltaproteobacteria bacterium ADurb.Bin207]HNS95334.1 helix-turn-helix domain-containing protein [Polyangiaceae bacterium]HNZ23170.1 helix-turn-helix domain-containing protein [Polyangiaceae bacterium]HOD24962.1 helix-turn-helix domain-containing protein [Polyangiaceae bacterium]HOE51916.1 helix-turn-helix domain-containing protein [Polyangiaceae bacterium]